MQQLEHAAHALGWNGHIIPDLHVLGAHFAAVARLRTDVHRWRVEHGWEPEPNPAWFRSWSDPNLHDHLPVAAVELVGLLVPVTKAKRGTSACGTLLTIAPCAIVLPMSHPHRPWPLVELDYYGIGVVKADDVRPAELVLRPEDRSAEFGCSLFCRWLLELLYSRVLQHDTETATNS